MTSRQVSRARGIFTSRRSGRAESSSTAGTSVIFNRDIKSAMVFYRSPSSSIPSQATDYTKLQLVQDTFVLDDIPKVHDHTQGQRNVYKFGGTSVGSPQRLKQLVSIVSKERSRVLAVIVSAMGKSTDGLIRAADLAADGKIDSALDEIDVIEALSVKNGCITEMNEQEKQGVRDLVQAHFSPLRKLLHGMYLLREKTPQAMDAVLAFGERISAQLVAQLLSKQGTPAVYVDARRWVQTDLSFGKAKVAFEVSKSKLIDVMAGLNGKVPVITGFIGLTACGKTTTLGRNGSDYTATLVGACLKADYVVINTDISGVMTADPRGVQRAVPVSHLNHHEALELAIYGTRMFHARTMLPLINAGVTMLIRNTMSPEEPGTYISKEILTSKSSPTCVTSLEHLTLIEVRTRILQESDKRSESYVARRVIETLELADIHVWLSIRAAHGQAITVIIPQAREEQAYQLIQTELKDEIESKELDEIGITSPVTMLSIVGDYLSNTSTSATRFFSALSNAAINVLAIGQGTSSRSLSCIVRGEDTKLAVRRVHDAFNISCTEVNVVVLGSTETAAGVISHLKRHKEMYMKEHGLRIRIVGFGSTEIPCEVFPAGIDEDSLLEKIASASLDDRKNKMQGTPSLNQLDAFQEYDIPILIDCTSRTNASEIYAACFSRGIHVVSSNSRSVNGLRACIKAISKKTPPALSPAFMPSKLNEGNSSCYFLYDSALSANLPVLDTMTNILRTGDRLQQVESALSGSIDFITDQLMKGVLSLSESVQKAFDLGYMEEDPRHDLLGIDVANKLLVMCRALSLPYNFIDIKTTPLVPEKYFVSQDVHIENIVEDLKRYEEEFSEKWVEPALEKGLRLRYIATLRFSEDTTSAEIAPRLVDESHPAYRIQGDEIMVSFLTELHQSRPLVLTGSGTGKTASANGVMRDVLKIVNHLKGN